MFQEVNLKRALEKQLKEKDVYATPRCTEPGKEGYLFIPLSDMLKEFRFLVDVPAIENPDFAEAVQKMTQSTPAAQESTQEHYTRITGRGRAYRRTSRRALLQKKTGRTLTGASDAGRAGDEPVSDRKGTGDNTKHGIVQAKTAAEKKMWNLQIQADNPILWKLQLPKYSRPFERMSNNRLHQI